MALTIRRKDESDALLSLLKNCAPASWPISAETGNRWATCTKFNPRLWADVNRAEKPALFLVMPREKKEDRGDNLQRRIRMYQAWIYLRADAAQDPNNP